jgi:hypothetical protein
MRLFSSSFIGLWSSDKFTAFPSARHITARESPALAQNSSLPTYCKIGQQTREEMKEERQGRGSKLSAVWSGNRLW